LQTLIREGRVSVNGRRGRASLRLRDGDRICLELPPKARASPLVPEPHPLAIVFEDDVMLVLDKPPGMVVHPGAGVRTGTLVHALLHHDPAIAGVGGEGRPGIVHRLDKDTSGLMVVAKTDRAFRALVAAIQERRVSRVYRALVWGDLARDSGRIEAPIGRDPRQRQRMAVVARGGKPAATRWEVLERFGPVTLLALALESGRTHQIRVHLGHRRHPVVGDPLYGGRGKKLLSLGSRERSLGSALLECLPRQALHASELRLEHPITGRSLRFNAPCPSDFERALEMLRAWLRRRRD
jgi:23S rRNA pseudouridine1911/1915/1917 synthase